MPAQQPASAPAESTVGRAHLDVNGRLPIRADEPIRDGVILAAGGVVVRAGRDGPELAIVHRRRYGGDWALPKGKLEPGETWEAAALREVREETGLRVQLERYVGAIGYLAGRTPKAVLFWRMVPVGDSAARLDAANDEVREVRWLSPAQAVSRLSYADERRLVRELFGEPDAGRRRPRRPSISLRRFVGLADHGRDRLAGSLRAYELELEYLRARAGDTSEAALAWAAPAEALVRAAWDELGRGRVDAGFRCFLAAQRVAVCALSEAERRDKAAVLLREARKIDTEWRRDAIAELLEPHRAGRRVPIVGWLRAGSSAPSAAALMEATWLRDDHFHNQYFKLDALNSQLRLLSIFLISAFVLFLCVLVAPGPPALTQWLAAPTLGSTAEKGSVDVRTVLLTSLFGIVGAAFSAILSTEASKTQGNIPERLSAGALTISRAALGAPAALLALFLLRTGLIRLANLDVSDSSWIVAVAFAAGFSERIVVRAVESVSGKPSSPEKSSS